MNNYILFVFLILSLSSISQTPNYKWIKSFGSSSEDAGLFITKRNGGSIYIAGRFSDTLNIDGTEIISKGGEDAFMAKLDSLGNLLWVKRLGGATSDEGKVIGFDSNNNIYFAGKFHSPVAQIGDTVLLSCGCSEFTFVSKFSSGGDFIWARGIEGDGAVILEDMTINSLDEIIITGTFYNSAFFESGTEYSNGNSDIFMLKYNTDGEETLVKTYGGSDTDYNYGMCLLSDDNIILTGKFKTEIDFGTGLHESQGMNDIYLVKLDSDGNTIWSKTFGGTGDDVAFDVVSDINGFLIITGSFTDTTHFELQQLISNGFYDVFTAKFNENGDVLWAESYGNNFDEQGNSLSTDINGNIYATGKYMLDFEFGSNTLSGNTYSDAFILKWDQAGNELWAKKIGGYRNDEGMHIYTIGNNELLLTGYYRDSAFFDTYSMEGIAGNEIFLARLTPEGGLFNSEKGPNLSNLIVYPNPATNLLNIQSDEIIQGFTLYNSLGQSIMSRNNINDTYLSVFLSGLYPGYYFIQIVQDHQIQTVKFIKH